MLRILFTIGALALASQAAWADEWSKHWNVSGKPELRVSTGDASVVVEAGNDHSIDAHLTTIGWAIGGAGVRVEEHQVGDKVEIEVKVPNSHWSFGNHSIRLEVRVPRELIADLHTGDGSISLRGLHGVLRADTGDGSIHGDDLDGALDAHTGDGSVRVAGRFDKLQLHTQDGSVEAEVKEGSRLDGDWRIQTGDGSVRVRVPKNLAADLEAHTGDGHIRFELPVTTNGAKDEHTSQAKLNGGGPALVVRTGDGSITVSSL
jgi:putative adhesin